MTWEKQPAVAPKGHGCLNCGTPPPMFPMDRRIAVGFGCAALFRDGVQVWTEEPDTKWEDCLTGQQAEDMAAADPDHDWQIMIHGPLSGRTYQRHEPGQWVMIESNEGFA